MWSGLVLARCGDLLDSARVGLKLERSIVERHVVFVKVCLRNINFKFLFGALDQESMIIMYTT